MFKKILIAAVAGCSTLLATAQIPENPFGHALVPDMIADASISYIDGTFYCHATTDGYGRGLDTSGPPVCWTSKDFVHWQFDGVCFPSADGEKYWAPSKAVPANGHWYIYPTVNGIMHVGIADSPKGPFRLLAGEDKFLLPYSPEATLLTEGKRWGIDAEIFQDDDGQTYVYWQHRHVGRLAPDMRTVSDIQTIETRRKEYSEGPIFFKRKGIYYFLYTIGGSENYEYYYQLSRTSPLGPWETPAEDRVSTTNAETGVFGPGHGCVFNVGDDYYFAFLEFGLNSTNRMTYVNKLEFNDDGTIRPVQVTLDGVGALAEPEARYAVPQLKVKSITASTTRRPYSPRYFSDERCKRTEHYVPAFAIDGANGSRWMATESDGTPWLTLDLGEAQMIGRSEIAFSRPTAGHTYVLEGSHDSVTWHRCGGHNDLQRCSPHVDTVNRRFRYLRCRITSGVAGIYEWNLFAPETKVWGDWTAWGQQPDGTYMNPIIPADYSDLDAIQVGKDYYAISSTMQFSPGMTILHSRDLVNWEFAGHAVSDLTQISQALNYTQMDRYGRGIWAGTLRYHNGLFYCFFGTPDEGVFVTTAKRPEGPWSPLTTLIDEGGWDDCTAIWDENGRAWFLATHFADGYKSYLFPMADDGLSIDRSRARLVNEGNGREASKLIHHDGYYYLVFSEYKWGKGRYVMAKRDRSMEGTFSEERQLLNPCVEANEPNQGGIVLGPDKKWYFVTHHGSGDWAGRQMSLLPVTWQDGWPMMGKDMEMVWQAPMPVKMKNEELRMKNEKLKMKNILARSDEFDDNTLGPQWQWNYQPRTDMFSLTERPGWLRLKAFRPLEKDNLMKAGNTLTQRSFRSLTNEVTVSIYIGNMTDGQHAGLCHFSPEGSAIGIVCEDGSKRLEFRKKDKSQPGIVLTADHIWLRSTWSLDAVATYAYSTDGNTFTPFGTAPLAWGHYRGDRIGIYNYNDKSESGAIDVDFFHYDM